MKVFAIFALAAAANATQLESQWFSDIGDFFEDAVEEVVDAVEETGDWFENDFVDFWEDDFVDFWEDDFVNFLEEEFVNFWENAAKDVIEEFYSKP